MKFLNNKFFVLLSSLYLTACSDHHQHKEGITAQELYEEHCASCHLSSGKGKFLKGIPPNKYTQLTSDELIEKITQGSNNKTKMKVFESMSQEEARAIANYVLYNLKQQK